MGSREEKEKKEAIRKQKMKLQLLRQKKKDDTEKRQNARLDVEPEVKSDAGALSVKDRPPDVYDVEKIVGIKKIDGVKKYRVRWVGYTAAEDTWEPIENLLSCKDCIAEYQNWNKQKRNESPQYCDDVRPVMSLTPSDSDNNDDTPEACAVIATSSGLVKVAVKRQDVNYQFKATGVINGESDDIALQMAVNSVAKTFEAQCKKKIECIQQQKQQQQKKQVEDQPQNQTTALEGTGQNSTAKTTAAAPKPSSAATTNGPADKAAKRSRPAETTSCAAVTIKRAKMTAATTSRKVKTPKPVVANAVPNEPKKKPQPRPPQSSVETKPPEVKKKVLPVQDGAAERKSTGPLNAAIKPSKFPFEKRQQMKNSMLVVPVVFPKAKVPQSRPTPVAIESPMRPAPQTSPVAIGAPTKIPLSAAPQFSLRSPKKMAPLAIQPTRLPSPLKSQQKTTSMAFPPPFASRPLQELLLKAFPSSPTSTPSPPQQKTFMDWQPPMPLTSLAQTSSVPRKPPICASSNASNDSCPPLPVLSTNLWPALRCWQSALVPSPADPRMCRQRTNTSVQCSPDPADKSDWLILDGVTEIKGKSSNDSGYSPNTAAATVVNPQSPTSMREIRNDLLNLAVKKGDHAEVRRLLSKGGGDEVTCDVEQANLRGTTLLMIALTSGYEEVVKVLLNEGGANANALHLTGLTPLLLAIKGPNHIPATNAKEYKDFLEREEKKCDSNVAALLAAGAWTDVCFSNGDSALVKACSKGYAQVVRLLLNNGANFVPVLGAKFNISREVRRVLDQHVKTVRTQFEAKLILSLKNKARILSEVFPIHSFYPSGDISEFEIEFQQVDDAFKKPDVRVVMFIPHCDFTEGKVSCSHLGPHVILEIILNGVVQSGFHKISKSLIKMTDMTLGRNHIKIRTAPSANSKIKLLIGAYKMQSVSAITHERI